MATEDVVVDDVVVEDDLEFEAGFTGKPTATPPADPKTETPPEETLEGDLE